MQADILQRFSIFMWRLLVLSEQAVLLSIQYPLYKGCVQISTTFKYTRMVFTRLLKPTCGKTPAQYFTAELVENC